MLLPTSITSAPPHTSISGSTCLHTSLFSIVALPPFSTSTPWPLGPPMNRELRTVPVASAVMSSSAWRLLVMRQPSTKQFERDSSRSPSTPHACIFVRFTSPSVSFASTTPDPAAEETLQPSM